MENIKSFFNLTANENRKNFFNIRTLIWGLFLVVFITGATLLNKPPEVNSSNWKENTRTQIEQLKQENNKLKSKLKISEKDINIDSSESLKLAITNPDKSHLIENTIELQKLEFAIKNNIPIGVTNPWTFLKNTIGTTGYMILLIFIIVLTINIISLEHKNNTLKQLLIRPHSRCKILLSKFSSIVFSLLISFIFTTLAIFLIGFVLYGKNGMNTNIINIVNGEFVQNNIIIYILKYLLFSFIPLLPLIALTFLISLFFKSTTLPLIISYAITFSLSSIMTFLPKSTWVKYTLLPHLELTEYLSGNTLFGIKGMSLGFSITILLAYTILFLAISIGFFNKKDII